MSGFSHNCRHGRYVRLDRTLSLSLLHYQQLMNGSSVHGDTNSTSFVAINANVSTVSQSKTTISAAALAASSSLSPLLWSLLPAQFGVDPSASFIPGQTTATAQPPRSPSVDSRSSSSKGATQRQQQRVQHVRLPAGTVLQLRDLQTLLVLASATDLSLVGGAASLGMGKGTGYSVLRYPCSATDFHDYYFGTNNAYASKPSNNNHPNIQAPLSDATTSNNNNSISSEVSVVSAFAAEEVILTLLTHIHSINNSHNACPIPTLRES